MSGTGKSTALAELRKRGFEVVDTDEPGWTDWSGEEGGYAWREDRIAALLACGRGTPLCVSGAVSNQGRFYPDFDAVVVLSAPADVLLERLQKRTSNDYGKSSVERALILEQLAQVEPCCATPARTSSTRRCLLASSSPNWSGSERPASYLPLRSISSTRY